AGAGGIEATVVDQSGGAADRGGVRDRKRGAVASELAGLRSHVIDPSCAVSLLHRRIVLDAWRGERRFATGRTMPRRRSPELRSTPAMGLINWIFDIYQQSRIEDLQREAQQARAEAWQMRSSSGGVD